METKMENTMQLSHEDYNKFVGTYMTTNQLEHLRFGQAFHNYFRLDKCEQHREICDKLWNLDGQKAIAFIDEHFEFI